MKTAVGRTGYAEQFSGIYGGTLTAIQQTSMLYTILGQATQVQVQDLQPQTNVADPLSLPSSRVCASRRTCYQTTQRAN